MDSGPKSTGTVGYTDVLLNRGGLLGSDGKFKATRPGTYLFAVSYTSSGKETRTEFVAGGNNYNIIDYEDTGNSYRPTTRIFAVTMEVGESAYVNVHKGAVGSPFYFMGALIVP